MVGPLAAAGIGAAGSLIGGWMKGKQAAKAQARAYNYQRRWAKEGPSLIRKGAEDAGINPLVLMGASTYNAPSVGFGSDIGEALGASADGFVDALTRKREKPGRDRAEARADRALDLEEKRLNQEGALRSRQLDQDLLEMQARSIERKLAAAARQAEEFIQEGEYLRLPFGLKVPLKAGRSTADAAQRAWGEPGEFAVGGAGAVEDVYRAYGDYLSVFAPFTEIGRYIGREGAAAVKRRRRRK